jgi:hypothetical protein
MNIFGNFIGTFLIYKFHGVLVVLVVVGGGGGGGGHVEFSEDILSGLVLLCWSTDLTSAQCGSSPAQYGTSRQ